MAVSTGSTFEVRNLDRSRSYHCFQEGNMERVNQQKQEFFQERHRSQNNVPSFGLIEIGLRCLAESTL